MHNKRDWIIQQGEDDLLKLDKVSHELLGGQHTGARHSPSDQSPVPWVFVKFSLVYAIPTANNDMAINPNTVAMNRRRALNAHLES